MSSSSYLFFRSLCVANTSVIAASLSIIRKHYFRIDDARGTSNDDGEEDARERDLFEQRAHPKTLLENVTPFFGGVVFRVFTHLFFISLSFVLNPNHFITTFFFARDDDVQKLLRSARRQKIAKANRTAWKKLERHSRRIWTNSRTS